jgi:hypothetical protein
MTKLTMTLTTVLVMFGHTIAAQPLPRPTDSAKTVTLALGEYNRLIDLANRPSQGPTPAPVPSVLASADLRVLVERETARGTFTLAGNVLRSGFSRVSLLSGATLIDANTAGRPLPLVSDGNAQTALLPGPGPFSLTLDWGAPLAFTPGRASFVLPVPPAGTARATIDLPGDQADVHLLSGLVTSRSSSNGRTIVEATLDPGAPTEIWWSMRDSAPVAAAREVRTLADVLTLVTLADSDVRMVSLIDVTVVQGQPSSIAVRLPQGYELTSVSGNSLERSDQRDDGVVLTVSDASLRRHQFLLSLERPHDGGSFTLDTGFAWLPDVQRERGEVAVEGVGTLELSAAERDGMHRIDVRELNSALQSLARLPILSAFRYQRSAAAPPVLALDVKRFADAGVLAAVVDRAVATTLVTTEGRALTEITLQVQNRAQPFLKIMLPTGASIVSAEVAGEAVKPALAADGTRIPLLRRDFRPRGPYNVSFVYVHDGTPFGRKGEAQMTLPKMDLPIGIVEWEVFVPDTYSVRGVGGNVIDRQVADREYQVAGKDGGYGVGVGSGTMTGTGGGVGEGTSERTLVALPGQITGRVTDEQGTSIPGVTIVVDAPKSLQTVITDADGMFVVSQVPSGRVKVTSELPGFGSQSRSIVFDQQPRQVDFAMRTDRVTQTVTVSGESPKLSQPAPLKSADAKKQAEPSQNVINLQQRAAGVLPVRVDVPRAGVSHQFVRPLVVDEETVVSFRYKRR